MKLSSLFLCIIAACFIAIFFLALRIENEHRSAYVHGFHDGYESAVCTMQGDSARADSLKHLHDQWCPGYQHSHPYP